MGPPLAQGPTRAVGGEHAVMQTQALRHSTSRDLLHRADLWDHSCANVLHLALAHAPCLHHEPAPEAATWNCCYSAANL
eukprot:795446-Pelagomonas_calceolata.AAC.1